MWFVIAIAAIVVAGWIFMTVTADDGKPRNPNPGIDDYVPVNAYDNPYDTEEANDAPFEPDADGDATDDCSPGDASGNDD